LTAAIPPVRRWRLVRVRGGVTRSALRAGGRVGSVVGGIVGVDVLGISAAAASEHG
jgi:hypothetical protein